MRVRANRGHTRCKLSQQIDIVWDFELVPQIHELYYFGISIT